ncbi:MAG: hypothetical protein AAF383_02545 [Cyanobacteria bacterium P01_A01_bin.83]
MKKLFCLSTTALLLLFPPVANAEAVTDLTASEVFCSNTSATRGNAIAEINNMLNTRPNRLSADERQILIEMKEILDGSDTVQDVCSPEAF